MKKTAKRLTAVLLSLVILTGISGAAFADAEHDDCECCISESSEVEALRSPVCYNCERGILIDRLIGRGSWVIDVDTKPLVCPENQEKAHILKWRMSTYQATCTFCGYTENPYIVYDYAWYCTYHEDFI